MRLLSHEIGFDLADSLHPARYRDNACPMHPSRSNLVATKCQKPEISLARQESELGRKVVEEPKEDAHGHHDGRI